MVVGKQLVELCRQGKSLQALDALYSPGIVSIEAMGNAAMPARMEGLDTIRGKNDWWLQNHDVHGIEAEGPWPHGDRFIVRFKYDVTPKAGPMAGNRFTLDETALYTVAAGKISRKSFSMTMGS